jgi:hypothetical protein
MKTSVDVGAKCTIELLVGDVFNRFLVLLIGGIVDDDIQPAKGLHRALDRVRAEFRPLDIAGNQESAAAHGLPRCLGVQFFDGQVHDCDIGAFAGEQDGDRASYAGVAASDDCGQSFSLPAPRYSGGLYSLAASAVFERTPARRGLTDAHYA